MFSCLNCRKALIAKSKSHSEISYDGGKFRDEQRQKQQQQQQQDDDSDQELLTGDDLNDTTANDNNNNGSSCVGKGSRTCSDSGLRRSQTQVRGSDIVCGVWM